MSARRSITLALDALPCHPHVIAKDRMFSIFKKKATPLLIVRADGKELCRVTEQDLPCEMTPSVQLKPGSVLECVDSAGDVRTYELGSASGWFHFSVRVHANLGCQVDCVISEDQQLAADAFATGKASGIRFQPFFLPGAEVSNSALAGKGLFARGLHYGGTVTSGNVVLSCVCDHCQRSFLIRSYHAGFSNAGYFYSASGAYTMTVDSHLPGSPAALSEPDTDALAALESSLPLAPDGSSYSYLNPFRCPHCSMPYIDFRANPGLRESEYYGNYFDDSTLLRYVPADA
ncbi:MULTISPECIES: hypothetical protein [unclassified Xanthomonas]|uniref:hypothetical protein n=1 Tax=unclassified Xanthomonas TaxID=2643310 RepID=UPI002B22F346|nr:MULTISPECIES: hypothetical protein [unclassified Xanthomonas]MEA9563206.1 hypothetical protein [Xanthomonas sp. WHRI 8932A]MEA9634648.1 hypothetical protein [Xanthomonas sp. WHRI 8812E]